MGGSSNFTSTNDSLCFLFAAPGGRFSADCFKQVLKQLLFFTGCFDSGFAIVVLQM